MALARCGAAPITALTDSNDKARLASEFYEPTVQAMLRRHPWNFAIKREELAEDADAPIDEWAKQFVLPADPFCIRVLQVNCGTDDFVIEGRLLLTDADTVKLRYVARVNESEFDPIFVESLVLQLASKFAYRLQISETLRGAILQELNQLAMPEARSADAFEQREPLVDPASESTWVTARRCMTT